MTRRIFAVLSLAVGLLAGCVDQTPTVTAPSAGGPSRRAIVDEARGGTPEFFWLPPTVPTAPTITGPFDATALPQLVVEICELDASNACVAGDPVERFADGGTPVPERITVDPLQELYTVDWLTGRSHLDVDRMYRVRVLRDGTELGFLDVQVVQDVPALGDVDPTRYVGVKRGQPLTISFRIDQPSARTRVRVNEIESSGGVPGDWVELYNTSAVPLSLSGYVVRDNDDAHRYTLPDGASIPAGGYYVIDESDLGFGLGAADAVRFFAPDGTTLIDSYAWTAHAPSTYGRCPDGAGAFQTTTVITKGAANDCRPLVVLNEVESSGGVPGDWVELYNPTAVPASIGGFVFRDNDDTHSYVLPAGTIVPSHGRFVLNEADFGFGLGAADAARLFRPDGSLVDAYTWTTHAATTYGRCPDGTGAFTTTGSATKGAANDCSTPPGQTAFAPWPGGADVQTASVAGAFGGNLSGLTYEAATLATPAVLWAVKNGPGTLYRLVWNGSVYAPDPSVDWTAGKTLRYPGGTGNPDAEGVTFALGGSAGGMYVGAERDNDVSAASRNSILRYDVTTGSATLTATHEWNLTADLPVVGANLGIEAVTWVADGALVARGFFDEAKGHPYDPAEYADHQGGLFLVGVEGNGTIYAYALDHVGGGFTRIATIASGLPAVMALEFDRELDQLWAVCDNGCSGRSSVLRIGATGRFTVTQQFERPAGMPNVNNEGFAFAPLAECASGRRSAFWSDDSETDGFSIRRGSLTCSPF